MTRHSRKVVSLTGSWALERADGRQGALSADMEHLNYAKEENRVVVTFDNDFLKLHEAGTLMLALPFHTGLYLSER